MPDQGHFWDDRAAAERYARFRPDSFHRLIVDRLRPHLGDGLPLDLAVDLGSGTGQSSRPLLNLAQQVIGVEPSAAMRMAAGETPGIAWRDGRGEATGLPDGCADLVLVGLAFHWT